MRKAFAASIVKTLLALFLVPGLALGFAHHFKWEASRAYQSITLMEIAEDPYMPDADRKAITAWIFDLPPAQSCFSEGDVRHNAYRDQWCGRFSQLWQHAVVERTAALVLVAGFLLAAFIALLARLAFARRSVQYRSFVLGWRVLVPASALQVALQGIFLVYLSYWIPAIYLHVRAPRLAIPVAILVGLAVVAAVVAIFRRPPPMDPIQGELLEPAMAPRLWSHIREVAAQLGTAPPAQIVAGIDANFFVTEAPLQLQQGGATQGRSLYVSIPLLRILETDEANAILAHELAHSLGGDTANSAALGPKLVEYDHYAWQVHHRFLGRMVASQLLYSYRLVFELALSQASREREFAADAIASRTTSGRTLACALIKTAAYATYRGEVESELFEFRQVHEGRIGIADRIASGLPAFSRSDRFLGLVDAMKVPHPFDSHPPLPERIRQAGVHVEPADFPEIACARPATTWASAIEDAEGIEQRLWQEFETEFAKFHEETLAYRYEPADEAERQLVLRHFPDMEFPLKDGQTIRVGYAGIELPRGGGNIEWDRVSDFSYENGILGADRLTLEHPEKGWLGRKKTVVSLDITRGQRASFQEALGTYWQRHQIMRSQQQSPEALAPT
jgi:Zn-dependent protease with chaperone function